MALPQQSNPSQWFELVGMHSFLDQLEQGKKFDRHARKEIQYAFEAAMLNPMSSLTSTLSIGDQEFLITPLRTPRESVHIVFTINNQYIYPVGVGELNDLVPVQNSKDPRMQEMTYWTRLWNALLNRR